MKMFNSKYDDTATDIKDVDIVLAKLNKLDQEIKKARVCISQTTDIKQAILDKYLN